MSEVKFFEIRDRATYIGVMAMRLGGNTDKEIWMLDRAGFGMNKKSQERYFVVTRLDPVESQYDKYSWGPARTMRVAHDHIENNWSNLITGDVIDVEFLEEETEHPKVTEMPGGE